MLRVWRVSLSPAVPLFIAGSKQAELDDGDRPDGLYSEERDKLRRLRREVKQLRQERDILSKAGAWFAHNGVTLPKSSNA